LLLRDLICGEMQILRSYESLSGAVDASFQQSMTSQDALDLLKAGALRAQENRRLIRDAAQLREDASRGQAPYAAVLSCIDSRVPVEQIFDAVSGDLFVARVAGNVAASSVVASLEFATALAGAKAILVLGHTKCGAVKGACAPDQPAGVLGDLLARISPAVETARQQCGPDPSEEMLRTCSLENVRQSCADLLSQSDVLASLVEKGDLCVHGALFDVATGSVVWEGV
jgi:carbonic anhydrase